MSEKLYGLMESWHPALQILLFVAILALGTFFLVKFSDLFVDGASAVAKKLKVSSLIIGLTIVAMGTSCPELAVSVSDSITTLINGGNANVAIGNVVGSNICNICIVLGLSCLFVPMAVKKSILRREYPFLLAITLLCTIFAIFFGLNYEGVGDYAINRVEGIILAVLIFVYIFFLIYNAKKDKKAGLIIETETLEELMPTWKAILFVVFGGIFIAVGGEFVVFAAKGIPHTICVSAGLDSDVRDMIESLVGLTIVAVGTSLPELVTSFVAAKKGDNEMALGNVIGSNIFNIVFVLGISATINPLSTGSQIIVDALVMMSITILAFVLSLKGKLKRSDGIILLCLYGGYLAYLITRTVLAS